MVKSILVFCALVYIASSESSGETDAFDELTNINIKVSERNHDAGAETCHTEQQLQNWSDSACGDAKCVKYFLCSPDGKINTFGDHLFDERAAATNPCKSLETCCKARNFKCIPPKKNVIHVGNLTKKPSVDLTNEITNPPNPDKPLCQPEYLEKAKGKCGQRHPRGIFGSLKTYENKTLYAQYAEFPWMLALLEKVKQGKQFISKFQGGASLIHPKVALTSAHKVYQQQDNPSSLTVRGGEWDTRVNNEVCDHIDNDVEKVIIHEQFDFEAKNYRNSIALLILKKNFKLNSIINIACLPPPETKFENQQCFGLGWGKEDFMKETLYSNFLKKVELPTVKHEECQNRLRGSRLGSDFELHEGFMCAGGIPERDTCTGDGGGPLNCQIPGTNNFYLAGIVATGVGCKNEYPAIYIDVSYFHGWIEDKIIAEDISPPRPFNKNENHDPRGSFNQ